MTDFFNWREYTLLDWVRWVIVVIAAISSFTASVGFTIIPNSRDDQTDRKYLLISVSVTAVVVILVLCISKFVSGKAAEGGSSGQRLRCGLICLQVAIVLFSVWLLISAILLIPQIKSIDWPHFKSELEGCESGKISFAAQQENRPISGVDVVGNLQQEEEQQSRCNELKTMTGLTHCDQIFETNSTTKGTGKSRETIFREDQQYCVTTRQYICNIAAAVLAIIAVIGTLILEAVTIFNLVRRAEDASEVQRENVGEESSKCIPMQTR